MKGIRKAAGRGHARRGWLESFDIFSFADYYDPAHMGFRALRVINEDGVQPRLVFGRHSHRHMEVATYVIDGALAQGDRLGDGSVIRPGDVQRMSAGTGITHSEYTDSKTQLVHFLQILDPARARGHRAVLRAEELPEERVRSNRAVVRAANCPAGLLALIRQNSHAA